MFFTLYFFFEQNFFLMMLFKSAHCSFGCIKIISEKRKSWFNPTPRKSIIKASGEKKRSKEEDEVRERKNKTVEEQGEDQQRTKKK